MNHIRRIRAALAALAGTLLALAAASPAFARPWPPPGVPSAPVRAPAQVHTIVIGGMPGWQIALIAVGAALVAGAVAILTDRNWTARKAHATTTA